MRIFAILLIFMVFANTGIARDNTSDIKSGAMRLREFKLMNGSPETAKWVGHLKLAGLLYLDIDREPDPSSSGSSEDTDSTLSFLPDDASVRILPRISGALYPDQPKSIYLQSGKLFEIGLSSILGHKTYSEILKQGYGHYEWGATMVISDLETDIGCDSRNFYTKSYAIHLNGTHSKHADHALNLSC